MCDMGEFEAVLSVLSVGVKRQMGYMNWILRRFRPSFSKFVLRLRVADIGGGISISYEYSEEGRID